MRPLALLLVLAACDAGAPPPPAPRAQVRDDASVRDAATVDAVLADAWRGRKHSILRRALPAEVEPAKLPVHGIALCMWYLGGDSQTVIDFDAATLHHHENSHLLEDKPVDRTQRLTAAQLTRFRTMGLAAWDEDPTGPSPQATDIRQDLVVLDGDEAFHVSGYPIASSLSFGTATGRPAAAELLYAILERTQPR